MSAVSWLVAAWLLGCAVILLAYRRAWGRCWREPVFRHPVLVLESDDWGAGPLVQAAALDRLAAVLARHRDGSGRHPVLNLAVVLAVPDTAAIRQGAGYARVELDHPVFEPVRRALGQGCAQGLFSCQLHGLEHYWPAALAASGDAAVQAWLVRPGLPETEQLPSHLQSRWVDASRLPSVPHAAQDVRQAAALEVAAFRRIFGEPPAAVVPPTFVWTREVEQAWAAAGLQCVVTPGLRYTQRDADGGSGGIEGPFVNGQRAGATRYVVRTDYFEPRKGRDHAHALAALARDAAQGRPCILENHRDNFCRDTALQAQAEAELDRLLAGALAAHRSLRFLSTRELFTILGRQDPRWIVAGRRARLPVVWERIRRSGRPWKLLRASGLAAIGAVLVRRLSLPAADAAAEAA